MGASHDHPHVTTRNAATAIRTGAGMITRMKAARMHRTIIHTGTIRKKRVNNFGELLYEIEGEVSQFVLTALLKGSEVAPKKTPWSIGAV